MNTRKDWKKLLVLPALAALSLSATANAEEAPATDPGASTSEIAVDAAHFPDEVFRGYISSQIDLDASGTLSQTEIDSVDTIDFLWGEYYVTDLTGIEYFTSLETLECCYTAITSLDVSQFPKLTRLNCSDTGITSLDVSNNPELSYLECSYTGLTALDVSKNPKLTELHCYETDIAALDVSANPALVRLDCNNTNISQLDVTKNPALFALNCENTQVAALDLSQNPELYEVYVTNTPMTEIDVTNNPDLVHIRVSGTGITELDLSQNPVLAALYCSDTDIRELDLSNNPQMFEIYCYNTQIESLDLTGFADLNSIECYNTPLKALDVSKNPNLTGLTCSDTNIASLDVTHNPKLNRLELANTDVSNLDLSQNSQLRTLNISGTRIENLKNLDLSSYTALENVYLTDAGLESLILPENDVLSLVKCENNHLTSLDLSGICELWWEKAVSPQSRTVYASPESDTLVFDMNTLVPDLSKVTVAEAENVSYDAATGLLTVAGPTQVAYTYDHGYQFGDLDPMEVTLNIREALPYTDVPADAWYIDTVADVYEKGLMTGLDETTFGPSDFLARAQFATILYRMEDEPDVTFEQKFPDVTTGQFYTESVLWAADAGIVTGYTSNGYFGPSDNINREQMAVMMYRYAKYKGYDTSAQANLNTFPDHASVNVFAKEAMSWCVAEGIITGDKGNLSPQKSANRAECATIITRYLDKVEE